MLEPLMHTLNNQRIILASGSVRRKEILQMIGLKFEIVVSDCEENLQKSNYNSPGEYALATAMLKTKSVALTLSQNKDSIPNLIIGADTVVACGEDIYEKPKNAEDAIRMINNLNGKKHTVHTGVTLMKLKHSNISSIIEESFSIHNFCETTDVHMASLSPAVIQAYVETKEPLDKAGAYGIQGVGGTLVKSISGDYYNVVGFPLHRFCVEMVKIYGKK